MPVSAPYRMNGTLGGMMGPMIAGARWRWIFLGSITTLLLLAMASVALGWVKVKMLPFDNKSEFQVILNMPEGSSLERTVRTAREIVAGAGAGNSSVATIQAHVDQRWDELAAAAPGLLGGRGRRG